MGAYSRLGDYHLLGYQGERLLEVGRLFEVRRLSTFSAIRVCAYLRLSDYQPSWPTGWALTRVWAIINLLGHQGGAYSTLGAYQPPWPSGGGRFFEDGRLSTFLAIRVAVGAYSRWGAYLRLGDYQPS